MSSNSQFPIQPQDLKIYLDRANTVMDSVTWKPAKSLAAGEPSKDGAPTTGYSWRASKLGDKTVAETLSLLKTATAIANDQVLLPVTITRVLQSIRKGLTIGSHVSNEYLKSCGFEILMDINRKGQFTPEQRTQFQDKKNTSAAVELFTTASYVVWDLSQFEADKVSSAKVDFHGVPELSLADNPTAVGCMMYYLTRYLRQDVEERYRFVRDEYQMITMTIKFFSEIIKEVNQRKGSLKHAEFFTDVGYKLVDSDFTVQGFDTLQSGAVTSAEFSPVEDRMIVGNRIAKHEARRIVKMILLYCSKRKMNPIMALGGLTSIRMGYGKPGTGKTLIIRYIATEFKRYCEMRNIPFLFWLFPSNMVSTFQGGTAERALEWWKRLRDLDKIIYAAIDDAEQNFEERTRQGVSAGVRENISVALVQTEGAGIVNPGNYLIDFMTNIPEQMDTAVLSRIQSKFPMNGAETWQDFVDQDYLWKEKYNKADPNFVKAKKPAGYEYLTNQRLVASVSALESEATKPSDQRILEAFDLLVAQGHNPGDDEFYGLLYERIHVIYPYFTSRDIRNIQQAISARIMDFEVPEVWFEDMKIYFEQEYSVKEGLVNDLMVGNMKGLTFADIRLREMVKYVDNLSAIANVDRERRITAYMADQEIRGEAERRYLQSLEAKKIAIEAAKKHPMDNRK